MNKSKFTETQIVSILKQADAGVIIKETRRQTGISRADLLPAEEEIRRLGGLHFDSEVCSACRNWCSVQL